METSTQTFTYSYRSLESPTKRSLFYILVAITSLLVVIAGFSSTYVSPMLSGVTFRPLVHLHGFLYIMWILLFIFQPWLIRKGNRDLHRKIGTGGFILAALMIIAGVFVSITGAKLDSPTLAVGGLQPKQFLLIPLTDMLLFGSFIGLALGNLKQTEYHKRFMLLATLAILPAAFGRLGNLLGITNPIVLLLMNESLLLIAIFYDWRMKHKIHRAYLIGGTFMLLVHIFRFPLAATGTWKSVGEWLTL